jgi:hypothetical protein
VSLKRLILGVAMLTLVSGCGTPSARWVAAPTAGQSSATPEVTASPTPPPPPPLPPPRLVVPANAADLKAPGSTFSSWAFLDRRTGTVSGSANFTSGRNTIESMIKPWIVSDYLRRLAESNKQPTQQVLNELTLTIVDSNDPLAEKYYQLGGADAVVKRLMSICNLPNLKLVSGKWSFTEFSAQDGINYAVCIADGRAAGPTWTSWVLETMRNVRGTVAQQVSGAVEGGRWGIIDALPADVAAQTSIKNGFTSYKDGWHVNCLAINPDFIMIIMMKRYGNLSGAAQACTTVAKAFVVTPP